MGPACVVVLGVLVEDGTQVSFAGDEQSAGAFGAGCAYPVPFRNASLQVTGGVWRGLLGCWGPAAVIVSLVYRVTRKLLSVPAVRASAGGQGC